MSSWRFCLIAILAAASIAWPAVSGAVDRPKLKTVVEKLSEEVTKLKAQIATLEAARGNKVFFRAHSPQGQVAANTPIPFTPVFNVGNGYNAATNIFVPPYSGYYILSLQMFPVQVGDLLVDLMKNDIVLVRSRVYDPGLGTSEAMSITDHLTKDDRLWVRVDRASVLHPGAHSFFCGILIEADG